jgi:hypothetical protein
MRRRLLAVLACVAACLGTALVTVPPAHADAPPPADGSDWPMCVGTQRYCVLSQKVDGVDVTWGADGLAPYAYTIAGGIGFGAEEITGGTRSSLDVGVGHTYKIVVRSGSMRPREADGTAKNVTFTPGTDSTGYTFSLTFQPTSFHQRIPGACDIDACGDDTTRANIDYTGFANGFVTDLVSSGLDAAEQTQRTGMTSMTSAQASNVMYDPDTNSLVVQLANPHLAASGTVVTGSYEAFLPDAFLTGTMNVPNPSALSTGTVTVIRTTAGASSSAPFTVSPVPGGIRISITGITFSSPTYRIHPGPSAPRRVSAHKISAHKARVKFRRPAITLGHRINRYQARCHKLGKAWHGRKGTASPITVGHLPKGKVYCQVRAHNSLGWGVWSAAKHT